MSNIIDVWDRGGDRHKAHSRATRLHTTYDHFEGASTCFVKYMNLHMADTVWKCIGRT
jgi:hypothetical protein